MNILRILILQFALLALAAGAPAGLDAERLARVYALVKNAEQVLTGNLAIAPSDLQASALLKKPEAVKQECSASIARCRSALATPTPPQQGEAFVCLKNAWLRLAEDREEPRRGHLYYVHDHPAAALRETRDFAAKIETTLASTAVAATQTPRARPIDLLNEAILTKASKGSGVTMIGKGEVASRHSFKPPIRITYVVKTNSSDLRIGYAATQIIFNWGTNPQQLRIDGGPAGGRHVHGAGRIPRNEFVTIVQDVTPERMTISVNGVHRAAWRADFSNVEDQVRVFPEKSTVTVRSITAEPLK